MAYGIDEVRQVFAPLGFAVATEPDLFGEGAVVTCSKLISATAHQSGNYRYGPPEGKETPLWIRILFPVLGKEPYDDDGKIEIGLSGNPRDGFTGQTYYFAGLGSLRGAAGAVVATLEANSASRLCPNCRGHLTRKPEGVGPSGRPYPSFFGCRRFRGGSDRCEGTQRGPHTVPWV